MTATALAVAGPGPALAAAVRMFSYDAANDLTRKVAGDLTFQFRKRLIFTVILNVRSTQGHATAELQPADEHMLGRGGLSRLIGDRAEERDLYEVKPDDQGREMIRAFCPGSSRAWLAFSTMAEARPLRVQVIGSDPAGGGDARLCETLDFQYRGEWKLPSGPGVPERDLPQPRHGPY